MARPKKEKHEIEQRYLDEALRLAQQYSQMLKDKEYMGWVLTSPDAYTEDMAISDLTGGGVDYGSERVQTSNISKLPERIGILLADGYVEKKLAKMRREIAPEYSKICHELWIIETAINERMDERTQSVFRQIFAERKPYSKVRYPSDGGCHDEVIKREINKSVAAIAEMIEQVEYIGGSRYGQK